MNINRRSFLKTTAFALTASAVGIPELSTAADSVDSVYGVEKKVFMSCRMCAQYCPMVGSVRNDRLIRIDANPNTPYPAVCARGRAAPGALYSPDRIKTPLIRVGERGSGEYRSASWGEALDMVAMNLRKMRDEGDAQKLAYFPRFNCAYLMDDAIITQYGSDNYFGYADSCFASATELGLGAVLGGGEVPRQGSSAVMGDYENAELAVLIGRNPAGGLVAFPWGAMFGRGRKNGMHTIAIDPRKPLGIGESDTMWMPVIPGTDLTLLNALANEIISKKYYDEEFLIKYTNADMLVNSTNMQPLEVKNPFSKESDYMVFDEVKNTSVMKSESGKPALFGSWNIGGIEVKTAFQMLIESAAVHTPEEAEKICGVKAEDIRNLASKLNETKPKCFLERGYRSTRYFNSTKEKYTISIINALLGSYGAKGGLIYDRGVKTHSPFKPDKPAGGSVADYYAKNVPGFELINKKNIRRLFSRSMIDNTPYKFRMALINGQNPVGGGVGGSKTVKALMELEFIAAISPFWNESIMYADVILPDCTFMERDEPFYSSYKTTFPVITFNDKAVEPLFDSKNGYWIMDQLAKRILPIEEYTKLMGGYAAGGMQYIRNYQLASIDGMNEKEKASFNPDSLLADGLWCGETAKLGAKAKNSRTGKIEIYSTFIAEWHKKMKDAGRDNEASYYNPCFTWADPYWKTLKKELGKDEFIPITGFHPLSSFTGAQTRNNPLLTTIGNELNYSAVFINASKGNSLGIESGSTVEISNIEEPDMVMKAKVILSETIEPNSLFSFYGVGAGYFNKFSDKLHFASVEGFNPNHIGNLTFSPLDGSAPSHDFIVKIRSVK